MMHALIADFSHDSARIPNIFAQNVYPIKDIINFSQLSGCVAFKTCYLALSKVSRRVACKQSELCQLCAFTWPFQTAKVIASAHSTDRLRIRQKSHSFEITI